jgi:hypothetical protein
MPPVAFEPTILTFQWSMAFRSLDRTATLIVTNCILKEILLGRSRQGRWD